jgi:hypothetical protein
MIDLLSVVVIVASVSVVEAAIIKRYAECRFVEWNNG